MAMQQFETETKPQETRFGSEIGSVHSVVPSEEEASTEQQLSAQTQALEQTARQLVLEAPARKRLRQRYIALCLGASSVTVVSLLVGILANDSAWVAAGQIVGWITAGVTSLAVIRIRQQLQDPRLRQITALDDVRAVGFLLDLMESSQEMWEYDDPSRRAIKSALIRLLPRLQASDTSWLTEPQRAALARALYYCTHRKYPWHYDPDLAVALLGALEQVGTSDALDYVQELATMYASNPHRERIRDAAESCLPFLQTRARERQAMETLLRASQQSTDPSQLLRPLGGQK